jgi:hypothetical protein
MLCWWSLRRLWVAVANRHCVSAVPRPLRKKRSIRRLNLICPKIGSIVWWRFSYSSRPVSVASAVRINANRLPSQPGRVVWRRFVESGGTKTSDTPQVALLLSHPRQAKHPSHQRQPCRLAEEKCGSHERRFPRARCTGAHVRAHRDERTRATDPETPHAPRHEAPGDPVM